MLKNSFVHFATFLSVLCLTACDLPGNDSNASHKRSKNEKLTTENTLNPDVKDLVSASNAFGLDLYSHLSGSLDNILISPYSLSSSLAMTSLGAKRNTWKEMSSTLHWSYDSTRLATAYDLLNKELAPKTSNLHELSIANALWVKKNYPILPSFLKLVSNFNIGKVFPLDMDNTLPPSTLINQWASKNTSGHISNLVNPADITSATSLVLTNAIYLKAEWEQRFLKEETHNSPFFLKTHEAISVEMMRQTASFPHYQAENFTFLEIPYFTSDHDKSSLGLFVLLPEEIDDLEQLEKDLTPEFLETHLSKLKIKQVELSLPRFKISTKTELNHPLQDMGMKLPFSSENADFSGIDGNLDLFISKALHSTWMRVDEDGTEAAAASAVVMNLKAIHMKPEEVVIDHPFIFFIIHKETGTILFLGRVINPNIS